MSRTMTRALDWAMVGLGAVSLVASTNLRWPEPTLGLATTAWVAALLMRRRFALAPLGVPIAFALRSLLSPPRLPSHVEFPVLLVAACVIGFHATDWRQVAAAGAVFPLCVAIFRSPVTSGHPAIDVAFISIESGLAMFIGVFVGRRDRHEQQQQERVQQEQRRSDEQRQIAVERERSHIARELHDIIWHSVSSMTVQGSAARIMLVGDDLEGARDALLNIEHTGHAALADMRRLLGMLRRDMSSEPLAHASDLRRLTALAERLQHDGVDVLLCLRDLPEFVPYGLQTISYRIILESLEAARSEGAPTVSVAIGQVAGDLMVEVTWRAMSPAACGVTAATLHQRVELYNGHWVVATTPTGEQVVRASLPMEADAP